jgi:hypothetical protein
MITAHEPDAPARADFNHFAMKPRAVPPMPVPAIDSVWVSVPKPGNRPEENEDAVASDPAGFRFAVADGATEGWQSGAWAVHLATAFVRRPPGPADFPVWLTATRRDWAPPAQPGPAPWYAEAKQREGSFATLLGVELRPGGASGWAWKAVAVGDSCLFHVRGSGVEVAFPIDSAAGFSSRPPLIPSSAAVKCPPPEWLAGRAAPGDLLLIATDAAAAHLLALGGSARAAALDLARSAVASRDTTGLMGFLQELQRARNDDSSLLALRIPDAPDAAPAARKQ